MPPPVLPAQAPTNIRQIRMAWEKSGHRLKSAVEKPVVVMMDATWKAASRTFLPSGCVLPERIRLAAIPAMLANTMNRYILSSSPLIASLNRLWAIM